MNLSHLHLTVGCVSRTIWQLSLPSIRIIVDFSRFLVTKSNYPKSILKKVSFSFMHVNEIWKSTRKIGVYQNPVKPVKRFGCVHTTCLWICIRNAMKLFHRSYNKSLVEELRSVVGLRKTSIFDIFYSTIFIIPPKLLRSPETIVPPCEEICVAVRTRICNWLIIINLLRFILFAHRSIRGIVPQYYTY